MAYTLHRLGGGGRVVVVEVAVFEAEVWERHFLFTQGRRRLARVLGHVLTSGSAAQRTGIGCGDMRRWSVRGVPAEKRESGPARTARAFPRPPAAPLDSVLARKTSATVASEAPLTQSGKTHEITNDFNKLDVCKTRPSL